MVFEWKKCYLNVPLNTNGIEEHNRFDDKMPNVYTEELSEEEYNMLYDIFSEWNQRFGIIIDIFEEEILAPENCSEALRIFNNHISNKGVFKYEKATIKLKNALEKAISLGMPLYLDF